MDIYSNDAVLQSWENQQIPKKDKRSEDIACLQPQAAFPLSFISRIIACGSDGMRADCFISTLAGHLSDPEILSLFTAAVQSMKHSAVENLGQRKALGLSYNLVSFTGPF